MSTIKVDGEQLEGENLRQGSVRNPEGEKKD
jgi:hypothetical protein